jgi:hypothetical protein
MRYPKTDFGGHNADYVLEWRRLMLLELAKLIRVVTPEEMEVLENGPRLADQK